MAGGQWGQEGWQPYLATWVVNVCAQRGVGTCKGGRGQHLWVSDYREYRNILQAHFMNSVGKKLTLKLILFNLREKGKVDA